MDLVGSCLGIFTTVVFYGKQQLLVAVVKGNRFIALKFAKLKFCR